MLRKWSWALILALGLAPLAARGQDTKPDTTPPTVVVRVQSFDAVVDNLKTLTKAVGQEQIGKQIDSLIKAQVGPGGLEGVDTKKSIGLYAKMGEDIGNVSAVLMVPIKDQQKFLKLLENVNYKAKKKGELYIVDQTDVPGDVGFRFAHGYAYITALNLSVLEKESSLLKPAQVFGKNNQAILSAVVRMDQIPKVFKDIALSKVDEGLAKAKEEAEAKAKTDVEKKFAGQFLDIMGEHVKDFLRGASEVAGELKIDPKTNEISFEYTVEAMKDSKLKKSFEAMAKHPSIFGGFAKAKADAVEQVHIVLPTDLKKAFNSFIDEQLEKGLADEPDAGKRAFAKKVVDAIKPTLHSGDLDMAAFVRTHKNGQITGVGALHVKEGAKLEQTFRDLYKALPGTEQAKFKLDVATAGNVNIHQINIQDFMKAEDKKVLGDGPLYFAVRSDAVFAAVGSGALDAIKEVVAMPVGKDTKVVHYDVKLGPILKMVLQKEHEKAAAEKAFANDPGLIRLTVEGGHKFQFKISASLSILEFAVAASQKNKEVQFKAAN